MTNETCKQCGADYAIKDGDETGIAGTCSPICQGQWDATENRVKAYAAYREISIEDADAAQTTCDEQRFEDGNEEYLVVTDSEADELWDADFENYVDECILHELPEAYRGYFDTEKWKSDAKIDGRAHSLSRYDGDEDEIEIDGETFYIYRQN